MAQTSGGSAAGERIAPTFELLESKLTPSLPTGSTPRARLLNLLENSRGTSVILVSAAPGYGKTTLLAQWASQSQQRFAWVTVDDVDNDPIVLLTYIAVALDRVSAIDPNVFHGLTAVGASIEGTIVPRLGAALERADPSFVLVLDDLHALTNPQCRSSRTKTKDGSALSSAAPRRG